jgi:parallel beta-helix repeat protein
MLSRTSFVLLPLVLGIAASEATADVPACEEFVAWRPSDGCPTAANRCLEIAPTSVADTTLTGILLPTCDWTDVELRITRSNTILNCDNQTLRAHDKVDGAGIHLASTDTIGFERDPVACTEIATAAPMCPVEPVPGDTDPEPGLHNVTVMNCAVRGYKNGVSLYNIPRHYDARSLIRDTYLEWFEHPAEATCRVEQVEDCLRTVSPHRILITDVSTDGQSNVGIYVNSWAHDVEITRSTITGTDHGPGIYLDSGTRDNVIATNDISWNGREAVAIDASADNLVQNNHIEGNGTRDGGSDARFSVGIAIYKNFWEQRWGGTHLPRAQRSEGNVIDDNDIVDHITGVALAMRQDWSRDDAPGSDGAWGDQVYYREDEKFTDDEYFYRERAAHNIVKQNRFDRNSYGVIVEDDDNQILGNTFTGSRWYDVLVGNEVRQWTREPVHGTTVAGNVFSKGLRIMWCAQDTSLWLNTGGPIVTDACGLSRARLQAITANGSGHALAFGRRVGHIASDQTWLTGDFDADGRDDVLAQFFSSDRQVRFWQSRTGGNFAYKTSFQTASWPGSRPIDGQWVAGNFDGQGGDEVAYVFRLGADTQVCIWTPVGDGFQRVYPTASPLYDCVVLSRVTYATNQKWLAADFDRDGKDDLLQIYPSGTTAYVRGHRANRTATLGWFDPTPSFNTSYGVWRDEDTYLSGDFDRDGFGDVARIWRGPEDRAQLWVYFLGARGPVAARNQDFSTAPGANDGAGFVTGRRWLASDFDGDGADDIVLVYNRSGDARVWRHRSTGPSRTFTFTGIQTIETFVDTQRWLSGRFDANTSDDLLRVSQHVWY